MCLYSKSFADNYNASDAAAREKKHFRLWGGGDYAAAQFNRVIMLLYMSLPFTILLIFLRYAKRVKCRSSPKSLFNDKKKLLTQTV